jgi:beta-lactamase regulating signal transducer with metallopeptidase domain
MSSMEMLFRQSLIPSLGWALVHFLWQGALIALLLGGVNLLLRKAGAGLRYAVACASMLTMLAAGVGTCLWLVFHGQAFGSTPVEALASVLPATLAGVAMASRAIPSQSAFRMEQWLDGHLAWLVCVWAAGVVMLSLRTAGGWIFAQTLKRHGTRPAETAWQQVLGRLANRLGVARRIALFDSTVARVPTVIGWLRPVILLPVSALAGLTPQMMEAILAHELAHIRRHDYLVNMLQTAIETLLFYHPAVWWVGKKIRQERENCCDDLAVAACGDPLTYARALTELEQIRGVPLDLAMAATGGSLLARIRRLVGVRQPTSSTPSTWLAGIVALLTLSAVWAARPLSINYHGRAASSYAGAGLMAASAAQGTTTEAEAAEAKGQAAAAQAPDAQAAPQSSARAQSADAAPKDFIGGLATAGYQNLSVDQLITFKIHGVTPEFVREMEALGLRHPTPDELVTMRIHGVDPEFVNKLKAAGFSGLSIDQLVSFKIHGVDPARLAEMQKLWGKVSPDQVVTLQIHDVTPEYASQMKSLGMGEPTFDELVSMKIHDVTPESARNLKAIGLNLNLDQLVSFKIHGVEPARIAEIQKLGFGKLDADEILSLEIHGVTPEFLRGLKDLGFNKLTLDEALAASIHGVTPDFVKSVRKHGFNNLSMEQIIKLKQFDILPDNSN